MLEIDIVTEFFFIFDLNAENVFAEAQNTNSIMKKQQGCKLSIDFFQKCLAIVIALWTIYVNHG